MTNGTPITSAGMAAFRARYDQLLHGDRPAIVEVVRWAAGNGDRSENGDYLYGRKRLREIDRELGHLSKRMAAARVIDPARQTERDKLLFGRIGWSTPMARALRGDRMGDVRVVRLPAGEKNWEILGLGWP